ncbi:MAG: hypothetical protein HZB15_09180 [Actinobacteria bacterium]|nr:hypothetical protein [Actinomycetota bacterium]
MTHLRRPLDQTWPAALVAAAALVLGGAPAARADSLVPQAIVFGQPAAMVVGEPPQPLMVSASSGLPVVVAVADASICAVDGGALVALAAGTCSITVSQDGDATFAAARPEARVVEITDVGPVAEPPAALPTPDPAEAAAEGSVRGMVWLDRDPDGARGPGEWALERVTVALVPAGGGADVPRMHVEGTTERAADEPAVQRTAVTGADGSYRFDGVAVGAYVVTAAVPIDGVESLSDSDGGADWTVAVQVVSGSEVVADFAGLGHGALGGGVFDPVTQQGSPGAVVTCTWSGADGVPGTVDDAMFDTTADGAGGFDLVGLPYGTYTCGAIDVVSGRSTMPTTAAVAGPGLVQAALPLTPVSPESVVEPGAAGARTLPATGGDVRVVVQMAAVSVVAGIALLAVARHRRLR